MTYCVIKSKCTLVHAFNLRNLFSSFQSQITLFGEFLTKYSNSIYITYIWYIIYSIYTYICLKCTQFLKINGGNSLSVACQWIACLSCGIYLYYSSLPAICACVYILHDCNMYVCLHLLHVVLHVNAL